MDFKSKQPLYQLKELAEYLRSENGCPWDRKQTHDSLKKCMIEETYEVIDAIESNNYDDIREELGDLIFQVYAHSQIADEANKFDIDDVANAIIKKLIHRHPHVFSTDSANDADEVLAKWEIIKKKEKEKSNRSLLDGVPMHLPALLKAFRVQEKASRVGFDWKTIEGPIDKIEEELEELKSAHDSMDNENIKEEIGDILFSIVNVCRFMNIDPEEALQKTNNKFIKRFKYIEDEITEQKKEFSDFSLEELDMFWNDSKK